MVMHSALTLGPQDPDWDSAVIALHLSIAGENEFLTQMTENWKQDGRVQVLSLQQSGCMTLET
jgi:hypothetical protein